MQNTESIDLAQRQQMPAPVAESARTAISD
jgi:hypothetical protein